MRFDEREARPVSAWPLVIIGVLAVWAVAIFWKVVSQ